MLFLYDVLLYTYRFLWLDCLHNLKMNIIIISNVLSRQWLFSLLENKEKIKIKVISVNKCFMPWNGAEYLKV